MITAKEAIELTKQAREKESTVNRIRSTIEFLIIEAAKEGKEEITFRITEIPEFKNMKYWDCVDLFKPIEQELKENKFFVLFGSEYITIDWFFHSHFE